MVAGSNRVQLDLNSPEFQDVFFDLEVSELKQVVRSLRRLRAWIGTRCTATPAFSGKGSDAFARRAARRPTYFG